jgi:ubiquinol-cytochrome c reductase cytochrome c1 subunit
MLKFFSAMVVAASLAVVGTAQAAGGHGGACAPKEPWKAWHADSGVGSTASLQRGARNFMNYCSGCHSLQFMRYSRLAADLGLTEEQLKKDLMFTSESVHEYVKSSMPAKESEEWFGRTPPDLSLISRSRGTDYLYQFLKGFYVDDTRPTGANNLVLKDTAMPFVLADLAGHQKAVFTLEKCVENGEEKMVRNFDRFESAAPGSLSELEYDQFVRDTVNFLQYVGEPVQAKREKLGLWVILFLAVFTLFAWMLKKEIWKDVH